MEFAPIIIQYDELCLAIERAERNRGEIQVVNFEDGYSVEFSIEKILRDFWVRKIRIELSQGRIHPGALQLLGRAFNVPVKEKYLQLAETEKVVEMYSNEQSHIECRVSEPMVWQ